MTIFDFFIFIYIHILSKKKQLIMEQLLKEINDANINLLKMQFSNSSKKKITNAKNKLDAIIYKTLIKFYKDKKN